MFAAMVVVLACTGIWERVLALPCLRARTTVLASQGIRPSDQLLDTMVMSSQVNSCGERDYEY